MLVAAVDECDRSCVRHCLCVRVSVCVCLWACARVYCVGPTHLSVLQWSISLSIVDGGATEETSVVFSEEVVLQQQPQIVSGLFGSALGRPIPGLKISDLHNRPKAQ